MKPSEYNRRTFLKNTQLTLASAVVASTVVSRPAAALGKANTLALKGGTPVRGKPYSETWPIFDDHERRALIDALDSRNWCCLRGNVVYDNGNVVGDARGQYLSRPTAGPAN